MISIAEEDRDVLRFLWVRDITQEPPEVCTLRFARVVFGVSPSPFLLNATIKYHLERFRSTHADLVENLLRSTYVDDIVTGADSEEQAFELYTDAKGILQHGGFNLRKFITNSSTLQHQVGHEDEAKKPSDGLTGSKHLEQTYAESTLGNVQSTKPGEHKILGVRWDPDTDQLIFDFDNVTQIASTIEPTKRNIVSTVGKLYDPLGFIAPITIRLKIFLQTLCESKIGWDELLPETLNQQWQHLVQNLREGQSISLPRTYFAGNLRDIKSCYLCGFCDASTKAYAAVVYLVVETWDDCSVSFVTAKTRVAPLRQQTIPRLELLSALLLSRLITTVTESLKPVLPLTSPRCYTDSQVALYWIQGINKEWKPFIQNRVKEIRGQVSVIHWKHCSGNTNPADIPSRGLTSLELSVSQLWRKGPEWLKGGISDSDEDENSFLMPEECAKELKAQMVSSAHNMVVSEPPTGIGDCMNCEDYGSMIRLCRTTAYLLRAVEIFKSMRESTPSRDRQTELTAMELIEAEKLWITQAQTSLIMDRNFEIWKKQLGLYLDEIGLWRCRGRLGNAEIPYDTKHPILLPKDNSVTCLIVREAHERVQHNGVKETLTEVRARFWIIKGRSLVRSIVYHCVTCKRFEGAACRAPPPPPLPTFRVNKEPPFSFTGVDFAGPFYVQRVESATSAKVWLCLFTCCVTRAVHLEIVPDLSTGTFIRCLKRFAARRGLPRKFISDNGQTFKAAAKVLTALLRDKDLLEYLSSTSIEWSFNVEKAPWWGGFFERMVKSVKRCLRKMIGQAKFNVDELHTAVVEVEGIINSRPLSYITPDDLEEPLTPSHLLIGRRVLSLPDNLGLNYEPGDEDFDVNPCHLSKRMRHLNNLLNHFWRRWRNEYLLELRNSHRQGRGEMAKNSTVKVGDIVLVHDKSLPRGFWKMAKVKELITGLDGRVRAAVVQQYAKNCRTPALLRRPLQLLYPLEVHAQESNQPDVTLTPSDDGMDTPEDGTPDPDVAHYDQPLRRSKRAAALQADQRRRACEFALDS